MSSGQLYFIVEQYTWQEINILILLFIYFTVDHF